MLHKKRLLAMLCTAVLCAASPAFTIGASAFAEAAAESTVSFNGNITAGTRSIAKGTAGSALTLGDFSYTLLSGGNAAVSGYTGSSTELVIPSQLGSYTVTAIAEGAFSEREDITSLTLPETVTEIGDWAFYRCTKLASIDMKGKISRIGEGAFQRCSALKGTLSLGSVDTIGFGAFFGCSFSSVKLGKNIRVVEDAAFSDIYTLNEITVDESNPNYTSKDGILYTKDLGRVISYPCNKSETKYILPAETKIVAPYAVSDCDKLQYVFVPGAESVMHHAFYHSNYITEIILAGTVTSVEASAFDTVEKPTVKVQNPKCAFPDSSVKVFEKNAVVKGHTDSTAAAAASRAGCKFEPLFVWGKDNWNFLNSEHTTSYPLGGFQATTLDRMMNSHYLEDLVENLSNIEYRRVFLDSESLSGEITEAAIKAEFNGCCNGMSSLILLAKCGIFDPKKYGASSVNGFKAPYEDMEVASLVAYYQVLQFSHAVTQARIHALAQSDLENLKELLLLLDTKDYALISFYTSETGHAVFAYGYESGSYTSNKQNYDRRIFICDPNCSTVQDMNFDLYFDSETGRWTIPAYDWAGTDADTHFNEIIADPYVINSHGSISPDRYSAENFVQTFDVETAKGGTFYFNEIGKTQRYKLTTNTGYWGRCQIPEDNYKFAPEKTGLFDLSVHYEDLEINAGSKQCKDIETYKAGKIVLHGDAAQYKLSMTSNKDYPFDISYIEISGDLATNVTLERGKDSYYISADRFKNGKLVMANKKYTYTADFTNIPYNKLVVNRYENELEVLADDDGDGIYNIRVTSFELPNERVFGDYNGDGLVQVVDALQTLQIAAQVMVGNPISLPLDQYNAIDVTGDGVISVLDAQLILQYSAMTDAQIKTTWRELTGNPNAPTYSNLAA